jgi:hypothetical protein
MTSTPASDRIDPNTFHVGDTITTNEWADGTQIVWLLLEKIEDSGKANTYWCMTSHVRIDGGLNLSVVRTEWGTSPVMSFRRWCPHEPSHVI